MNVQRACWRFALPVALVLAVAACGQSHNGAHNLTQNNAPDRAMPVQTTGAAPVPQQDMSMSGHAAMAGSSGQAGAGSTFEAMAGSKGYISESDANGHEWMQSHFQQCDSDHDGKVTRTEYDACHPQKGQMQPPQGSV